jgi:hypothetical protein
VRCRGSGESNPIIQSSGPTTFCALRQNQASRDSGSYEHHNFCGESVETQRKVVKLDDRQWRSQISSVRTVDLSVSSTHIQFCRAFFSMKERTLPRSNWARKKFAHQRHYAPRKTRLLILRVTESDSPQNDITEIFPHVVNVQRNPYDF